MNGERWIVCRVCRVFFFSLSLIFILYPPPTPHPPIILPRRIMHTLQARAHVALSPLHTHTHPLESTVAHSIRRRDSTVTTRLKQQRQQLRSAPPERRDDDFFLAVAAYRLLLSKQLYTLGTSVRVVPRTGERQLLQRMVVVVLM